MQLRQYTLLVILVIRDLLAESNITSNSNTGTGSFKLGAMIIEVEVEAL